MTTMAQISACVASIAHTSQRRDRMDMAFICETGQNTERLDIICDCRTF